MNRQFQNYFIDMAILATGFLSLATGIVKWPGLAYALGLNYQGLPMEALTALHDWAGLITSAFVLLHAILHIKWLDAMTRKLLRAGRKTDEEA